MVLGEKAIQLKCKQCGVVIGNITDLKATTDGYHGFNDLESDLHYYCGKCSL